MRCLLPCIGACSAQCLNSDSGHCKYFTKVRCKLQPGCGNADSWELISDRGAKQELMSLFTVNYGSSLHKYKRFNLREAPLHAISSMPSQRNPSHPTPAAILLAHYFAATGDFGQWGQVKLRTHSSFGHFKIHFILRVKKGFLQLNLYFLHKCAPLSKFCRHILLAAFNLPCIAESPVRHPSHPKHSSTFKTLFSSVRGNKILL